MNSFKDEILGILTDLAKVIRSFIGSRTTWVMLIGFSAVWLSSGKIEALQQLLAYLGLSSIWVIKMATQNVTGLIKNGGVKPTAAPQASVANEKASGTSIPSNLLYNTEDMKFDTTTWDLKPPVAFNKEVAIAEVERDAKLRGGLTPISAMFFTALDKISGVAAPWEFNNHKALMDAWNFIFDLAERAFEEIWGASYDDALLFLNDPRGCSTCKTEKGCTFPDIDFKARQLGMEYYFILRQYRYVKGMVDSLGE